MRIEALEHLFFYVFGVGEQVPTDRRAWECALLVKLRDELKAGNLSVRYSKRFARLDDFFIDDRRWKAMRNDFFHHSGLPSDPRQAPGYLTHRLGDAYDNFLKTAPTNSYAVMDEQGWHLSGVVRPNHDFSALVVGLRWVAVHDDRCSLPGSLPL